MKSFKPENYNSVSPYFVVAGAHQLIDLLKKVFDGKELRRYDNEDGTVMHAEVRIDDSVIMVGDSSEAHPAHKLMLHVYVPDVNDTFKKALENGCTAVEKPVNKPGDPDVRGSFTDFAGNYWAIGTQQ